MGDAVENPKRQCSNAKKIPIHKFQLGTGTMLVLNWNFFGVLAFEVFGRRFRRLT
jgi:hypothetical protein